MFPGRRRRTGRQDGVRRVARMAEAAHHPRGRSSEEREELQMGQLDAVLGNSATRRTFLKGTGVLAASGFLAACRKNVDESGSAGGATDRKSTRLNSSYMSISYAVFCLKKKKTMCTSRAPCSDKR